jgi:TetR/AcrR family transcriptional regulator, cholesterol catabolism regulator
MKTGRRRLSRARGGPKTRSAAPTVGSESGERRAPAPAGGRRGSSNPETVGTTTTTAESRRQRHQREILNRLVLAARDLLFSRSLEELRVIDLTEAADVGKGTFFNYFESKEQLLPPIVILSLAGQLQEALAQTKAGKVDAWSALKKAMIAYFCPPVGEWRTYENNLLLAMVVDEGVRRKISDRTRSDDALYNELVDLGQRQGAFRTDLAPAELRRVLRMFFHGLTIHFWMHEVTPTPPLVEEALQPLHRILSPAGSPPAGSQRPHSSTASHRRHPR